MYVLLKILFSFQKKTSSIMSGPPPPTYVCNRCSQSGHWYKNCPMVMVILYLHFYVISFNTHRKDLMFQCTHLFIDLNDIIWLFSLHTFNYLVRVYHSLAIFINIFHGLSLFYGSMFFSVKFFILIHFFVMKL